MAAAADADQRRRDRYAALDEAADLCSGAQPDRTPLLTKKAPERCPAKNSATEARPNHPTGDPFMSIVTHSAQVPHRRGRPPRLVGDPARADRLLLALVRAGHRPRVSHPDDIAGVCALVDRGQLSNSHAAVVCRVTERTVLRWRAASKAAVR
ncbi:hypothetical protein ACLQ3K_16170 [Tsukamurella sp. DT100]|uniref:hypothetical protein n=1 Tax=Tsukamurella sp. DT100 TaxID=3393415 RepID=UPI003CF9312D